MKIFKFISKVFVVLALSFIVLALKGSSADAATFNVVNGVGCTLPQAMENISTQTQAYIECPSPTGNDVIILPPETITLSGDLPIVTTPLSVIGAGKGQSIIDGGGNTKLFHQTLGTVNSTVDIEFRDFTARNISRASGSLCISTGSSTSSTSSQTVNISNLDLENCGQYSISSGMFQGTTNISAVNISSDSSADSIGIFSAYQLNTAVEKTSVKGYSIGVYFVSSGLSITGEHNLFNSTLTENKIGLFFFVASTISDLSVTSKLYNNTIVGNTNDLSGYLGQLNTGGILFGVGNDDVLNVDMRNNVVAGNFSNSTLANCSAGATGYSSLVTVTSTNNLSDDTCANKLGVNDFVSQTGIAAGLDVLADNGGGVKTMALLLGSAALDQGIDVGEVLTDARGVVRPQNAAYDIGAYEKTAGNVPDPDPDPENPGPPGTIGTTPTVPRTGKLVGVFLLITSLGALIALTSKELITNRSRASKSVK